MVIVTRNGIYVNIDNAILYVGIIYIYFKYQYVNVIWVFILVSFFLVYSCYKCLHVYPILKLPGSYMYLAAKKTVLNFTTCSSPMEGKHIESNDLFVRQSDC